VIERKGENRSHCRDELHDKGLQTYLQRHACELIEHRPVDTSTIKTLYDEIWVIANIFDVYDACLLVDIIEGHFQQAAIVATDSDLDIPLISVLWLDSWDEETPSIGSILLRFRQYDH
jgi:hypothetical protein